MKTLLGRKDVYSDVRIDTVVSQQARRVEDFLRQKNFFVDELSLEHFLADVKSVHDKPLSTVRWRGILRKSYRMKNGRDKYTTNEPFLTQRLAHSFAQLIEETGLAPTKLLDIGCGSGRIASVLAEQFGISRENAVALDIARPRNVPDNISFKLMKPDKLELHDAQARYDVVILSMVLHHSKNAEKLLVEAAEAVRPGGIIIVREHDASDDINQFLDAVHVFHEQIFPAKKELLPSKRHYRTLGEWQQLAKTNGLRVERVDYRQYPDEVSNPTNVFTMLLRKS